MVCIFAESGALTGKEVIVATGVVLSNFSLAYSNVVSLDCADGFGAPASGWILPSEKSSREGNRSAIV